ncbi:hypothetical protein AA0116_g10182 [Alternaria tenuissima]|nr:hypothetical protein AA0116_g10182 [Alternaria tenuissima]
MRMDTGQPPSTLTPIGLRFDPLRQHPVNPAVPVILSGPGPNTTSTRTIFLNHPFERLSPILTSSPRIVEADSERRSSVYLDVREIDTMHNRLIPGTDFFDDCSSESDSGASAALLARTCTDTPELGHRSQPHTIDNDDRSVPRGRSRHCRTTTALSNVTSLPVNSSHYSGFNEEYTAGVVVMEDGDAPSHVRKMSLTRLNRENVRLVDGRSIRSSIDSPRQSIFNGYNNSSLPVSPAYPASALAAIFLASATSRDRVCENGEDTLTPLPQSPTFWNGYHQRNASDGDSSSDSVLADSIINAHVHAMRALEALSADPKSNEDLERSGGKGVEKVEAGRSYLNSGTTTSWPKSVTSLSANRQARLSALSTGSMTPKQGQEARGGHDCATSPYVNGTNPFATPLPDTALSFPAMGYTCDSNPLPNFSLPAFNPSIRSTEDYARFDSACTSIFPEEVASYLPGKPKTAYNARKGKHVLGLVTTSVERLDLRSRRERNESAQGLIRSQAELGDGKGRKDSSARQSAGGLVIWVGMKRWTWKMRNETGGGRGANDEPGQTKLEEIVVPSKPLDSDADDEKQAYRYRYPRLNSADTDFDDAAFAERLRSANRQLLGQSFGFSARTLRGIQFGRRNVCCIASIHHTGHERRGSADKQTTSIAQLPHPSETRLLALYRNPAIGFKKYMVVTWARRIAVSSSSSLPKEAHVPTLELVYMVSPTRVVVVMTVLLSISVAAALAWVFLSHVGDGKETAAPGQRVGSGMAIGIMVLLVEACGFGVWVTFS